MHTVLSSLRALRALPQSSDAPGPCLEVVTVLHSYLVHACLGLTQANARVVERTHSPQCAHPLHTTGSHPIQINLKGESSTHGCHQAAAGCGTRRTCATCSCPHAHVCALVHALRRHALSLPGRPHVHALVLTSAGA